MAGAEPLIVLVAARARNGVIGRAGGLPWRIPADMRHFRRVTTGKPVVMGRKTFESIGRLLPERKNIIVTRDRGFTRDGAAIHHDISAALACARTYAREHDCGEIAVIGGGEIYRATLPFAHKLYLTQLETDVMGDAVFPEFSGDDWSLTSSQAGPVEPGVDFAYRFETWTRSKGM